MRVPKVVKTDAEWQKQLTPLAYQITREAGTERPFSGAYWNLHEKGLFRCICCDTALFSSAVKFDSGTGWPSFWQPIAEENVKHGKPSSGYTNSEVTCRRCDAHLGDLFDDGPKPTGLALLHRFSGAQIREGPWGLRPKERLLVAAIRGRLVLRPFTNDVGKVDRRPRRGVEVDADQLGHGHLVAGFAVIHPVNEANALLPEREQLGRDVKERAGNDFAFVLGSLIGGDGSSAVFLHEPGRNSESGEEMPGGFVESRGIELHVHVTDVIHRPRVHEAAVCLDCLVGWHARLADLALPAEVCECLREFER